jgi:outer membrane protein assembly factor BamB
MRSVSSIRLLLSLVLPVLTTTADAQSIIQVIPLPNTAYWNQAWGLTSDGTSLSIASNTSDAVPGRMIIRMNLTGAVVDTIVAPAGVNSSQGLAIDSAGNFYFLRRYTASGTILKLSPAGAVLDSFRIWNGKYPGGLAWDGTHLWFSIYYPNPDCGLYKLDFPSKTVIDTLLVPTLQPYGITWDGSSLLYVENGFDGGARGIIRVDPATGDTTGFIPEPSDPTPNGTSPHDAAWDGRYLWLLAEPVGASSGRALYKYDLGGGGTPVIGLASSLLDFGNVRVGVPQTLSTTILNSGTAPLHIDSTRVLLSPSFSTPLATPLTIDAGSSAQLSVTFTPAAFGPDTASLRIFSDDPVAGIIHLAVRGAGVYPGGVLAAPASHAFGPRRIGSSNLWRMTLQNQGGGQVQITGLAPGNPVFSMDSVALPILLDSLEKVTLRIWFRPATGAAVADSLMITSTASNGPLTAVGLQGSGDATPLLLAQPFWEYIVPPHPVSNTSKLVKGVRMMNDITGDGKPEVIICSENYWTMALNGNASGGTDSLWAFNTYISNSSAGSIGSTGDFSYQKALQIASDLNGDGYNDVVIGTGGGNEHVYAINGRTGRMLWTFGTDHPDSFSMGDITAVDVARDFNGDGVPEVAAASAATETGGVGGRQSAYLFNGANGALLWQAPLPGFTHGIVSIADVNGDGVPDVAGAVGQPSYRMTAFSGATGATIWNFNVPSSTGGAKEVMEWPSMAERAHSSGPRAAVVPACCSSAGSKT